MVFGHCEEIGKKLDETVIKLLWTQKIDQGIKQKRRLIAKKRLEASFNMGGLQIDWSHTIGQCLMLNTLQRFREQYQQPEEEQMAYCRIFCHRLRDRMTPGLDILFGTGGSLDWEKWAGRLQRASRLLSQMFGAYGNLLKLNEKSKSTWMTAAVSGHTESYPVLRITLAESVTLEHRGITCVADLFGKDYFTGSMQLQTDTDKYELFPATDFELISKCKSLRHNLAREHSHTTEVNAENFNSIVKNKKLSGLYRKMNRESMDDSIPGPPAYFTRQRDGISVPGLADFMKGYDNIFKIDISNKTREVAYLIMNRQTWNNKKVFLSGNHEVNESEADCGLCGNNVTEDTVHLVFSCEKLSEKVWKQLSEIVTEITEVTQPPGIRVQLHAFNVMYNQDVLGLMSNTKEQLQILIQELKRAIIYKRYVRCTTGRKINYNSSRINAMLLNVTKKLIQLKQYQGKNCEFFKLIQQKISDKL
jgi:hypothetical protein